MSMSERTPGHRPHYHLFDAPPPGSGGNAKVCRQCGERDLPTLNPECTGPRKATVDNTEHDYEPIL